MWKRFLLGACFSFLAYFSSATFIVQKKANGYSGFEKSKLSFSKLHATSDKIKRAKILNRRGQVRHKCAIVKNLFKFHNGN